MDQRIFACLIVAFAAVSATYFPLTFKESGRDYIEAVKTDAKQNIVELEVPAHGSIHPLGVLYDFSKGYSAKKDYQDNMCYISPIEKRFPKPDQMEKYMKMNQGQFENDQYEIIDLKIYPVRNMTRYEVGPKIAAFCYGYEMVLVAVYEKENVDEELGKLARGEDQDTRMRRQVFPTQKVMEIRNTCNGRISRSNWMRCPDTFNLHCKWETHNCYYFITCYQQQNTIGHVCHIAHPHIVRRVCCDIVCPT